MGPVAIYRATKKKRDIFWNVYICRPPAALVVYLLQASRVTPNQVTLSAVGVAALAAAGLVLMPGYVGGLLAILVFQISYVLDCTDGMLARLRGTQSATGHLLDFLMDELKAFMILAAVAVRLHQEHGDVRFLFLGIGGLVCLASGVAMTTFLRRPEIAGPAAEETAAAAAPKPVLIRVVGLIEGGAKFIVHYPSYILYAAALGRLEYYLYPYVAVNALYALRAFGLVALRFGR